MKYSKIYQMMFELLIHFLGGFGSIVLLSNYNNLFVFLQGVLGDSQCLVMPLVWVLILAPFTLSSSVIKGLYVAYDWIVRKVGFNQNTRNED